MATTPHNRAGASRLGGRRPARRHLTVGVRRHLAVDGRVEVAAS